MQPGDERELIELAATCFERQEPLRFDASVAAAAAPADPAPMPVAEVERRWRWKYLRRPHGNHSQAAVDRHSGRIVGHVGGLPFPTWCDGRIRTITQSTENMLSPELRAGLARVGVFAKLVNAWVDSWFGCERDWVAFGFPSNANFRIGQRFCKYSLLRPVSLLWRPIARGAQPAPARAAGIELRQAARAPADVDALWNHVRRELHFAIERSRAHLDWRYAEHPEVRYAFLEARDAAGGRLRGLAVVRAGGFDPTTALLVDWIVPIGDRAAAEALLGALDDWAWHAGLGGLVAWFPEGLAQFAEFQDLGFRVRYSPAISVARSWDPALPIETLRRDFYFTAGDIDYL